MGTKASPQQDPGMNSRENNGYTWEISLNLGYLESYVWPPCLPFLCSVGSEDLASSAEGYSGLLLPFNSNVKDTLRSPFRKTVRKSQGKMHRREAVGGGRTGGFRRK